jgi:hypothetical protein
VLSRSTTKPIFVALGTATVITLGAVALPAAAFAADPAPTAGDDPAPDPSSTPSASDPPDSPPPDTPPRTTPRPSEPSPSLSIKLSLSTSTAAPGGSVMATVRVSAQRAVGHHAVLRLSAASASVTSPGLLGDLGAERSASTVVTIPAGHGAGTVTVTASLSADRASTRNTSRKITITAAGVGATGAAGAAGGLPLRVPGLPGAATTLGGPAQAQLPLIGEQQPAVAPDQLPNVKEVSLRTVASPFGLDATAYRLFWTQVAWLTALLVGISLLLTQLRLNRRRLPARPAPARRPRP